MSKEEGWEEKRANLLLCGDGELQSILLVISALDQLPAKQTRSLPVITVPSPHRRRVLLLSVLGVRHVWSWLPLLVIIIIVIIFIIAATFTMALEGGVGAEEGLESRHLLDAHRQRQHESIELRLTKTREDVVVATASFMNAKAR